MADGGPWWILVGVSNLSENYFIKTFDSQEEALADARELIDFSSGYPCDPKNERRRFDTADKALEFLKTTGSLRITDRLSYGDDIKLFEVTEPMIEKIFNMN